MFCLDEVVADGEKGMYKDCTVDRAPLRYKSIMYNQECSTTENNVILLKLLTLKWEYFKENFIFKNNY